MRALVIVIVAIVLIAVAAVALAPASLVAPTIAQLTSNRVALAEVEGTVWNGRATIVGDDGVRLPFAWSAERLALARGELRVHVAPADGGAQPRGDLELRNRSLHAQDVSIVVPASWLASSAAKLPVTVGGDVAITVDSLDVSPGASHGGARLDWRDARVAAPGMPDVDLGTVSTTLTASGDRFAGPIANSGGDVAIAGDVVTFADGAGEANVLLTPRVADERLARLLSALGAPEGAGYRVRGRWRAR